jgi:hypothetical protein
VSLHGPAAAPAAAGVSPRMLHQACAGMKGARHVRRMAMASGSAHNDQV